MNQKRSLNRILIMAGGTGGHIFPGLALARYLREQGIEVQWLGTAQGLEAKLVPEAGFPLHQVTIRGLRGKGIGALVLAPYKIAQAMMQSWRIIRQFKPDMVIGFGGFVSGPGGVAAWLQGCPLVIHEQNAKAGLTNQLLAKLAKRVLEGFPGAFKTQAKVVTVGNPVRAEIENLPAPDQRQTHEKLRLLVLGGSLGAQALNEVLPNAISHLSQSDRPAIRHQTGEKQLQATEERYKRLGVDAELLPFIKDMANAYAWADVVLCRAGALTVAELCAVGLGAILVPYPYAVDDHQTSNADFMVKAGAAICIQQKELTELGLADMIKRFNASRNECQAMANAAFQLRRINVAKTMLEICKEIYP